MNKKEKLKSLIEKGKELLDNPSGKLLLIDLLKDTFHTFKINKNKDEIRKSGDE